MRIGIYQTTSPAGDIPAGMAEIEFALHAAAKAGISMLTMPELFLPGYNAVPVAPPENWGAVIPRLAQLCKIAGVGLTIGLPEYVDRLVYNSAYAFGADGALLAKYRKVQLYGPREIAIFAPGNCHVTFDYHGVRIGLLICYDVEFPEHVRALARAGAQVILAPTANMMPFVNVSLISVPARAMENGITIAYANYTGAEGDLTYVGHSIIAGPDGYPLASKGRGTGIMVAELPQGLGENAVPHSTQLVDYTPVKEW